MRSKEDLHQLLDELPESEVEVAARYLEYLRDTADPLVRSLLSAPEEDEELNDETRATLDEARQQARQGK